MKKWILAAGVLAFAAFKPATELPIGSALPMADTELKTVSGKEISLKKAMDKNGLLVMFSCNTCPYVIKNQERTVEISKYAEDNKIGVVILNSNAAQRDGADSYEAMKTYAKDQQYKWPYAVDEGNKLADAFGATRTPEIFLFNKEGKLVYHGAIDNNPTDPGAVTRHHLKEAINEMTAGKAVSVATSRSVGCTIKRG